MTVKEAIMQEKEKSHINEIYLYDADNGNIIGKFSNEDEINVKLLEKYIENKWMTKDFNILSIRVVLNDEPVFNYDDAIEFIADRCDIDEETIEKVLMLEIEYMRSIGLIDED